MSPYDFDPPLYLRDLLYEMNEASLWLRECPDALDAKTFAAYEAYTDLLFSCYIEGPPSLSPSVLH